MLGNETARKFRDQGVAFLEVFDFMLPRWRDHLGMRPSPRISVDCIHWIIPGEAAHVLCTGETSQPKR